MNEKERKVWSGIGMIWLDALLFVITVLLFVTHGEIKAAAGNSPMAATALVLGLIFLLGWSLHTGGFFTLQPNVAAVLTLFGDYRGTVKQPGWHWANPFYTKKKVSLRSRNLNGEKLKVNDEMGNPIEIAAVVVWQVEDTAQALYDVDDFARFVDIQTETAVRHVASTHPYDAHEDGQLSLRQNAAEITTQLTAEIAERVASAGVTIIESRLTRLSFAPEIAQAMLRRQQASAVVAARKTIVEGAVGMVELALAKLEEREIVELDQERKAAMVSNLLVVLCSEQNTQPIVNAGTLYQ